MQEQYQYCKTETDFEQHYKWIILADKVYYTLTFYDSRFFFFVDFIYSTKY